MANTSDVGLKAFEKYDKCYTHYKRPPTSKIYYPTCEEFADPIAYVAKIKPEAEKYGVIKIVPPSDFEPSFAIDKNKFTFTPRIQKLGEIEAVARERNAFIERISHYWELLGESYREPTLEGRPVDLFNAHFFIRSEGGYDSVCINKRWTAIAKLLGLKSNQAGSKLKEHFTRYVLPYIHNIEKREVKRGRIENDDEEEEKRKDDETRGLGEGRSSMQGGNRNLKSKSPKKKTETKNEKEIVDVCGRCFRGDMVEKLAKCENCSHCLHLFCMRPPMKDRPKSGWHCPSCIENRLRRMAEDQGFCDSTTSYTLNTFTTFANAYKREKFGGRNPSEVSLDEIEKLYWKNMLNGEMNLEVKYGADLMVSKVGSGFCRKADAHLSSKDTNMANHPWNLNNMPVVRDSVLSHIDSSISGMMVPWVYVGMVFSTFCWHTEDHWTYSVNYNHWGEPKIWYGIGADQATKFEEVVESICPSLFRSHSDLLHHMTVAVNPHLLRSRGVHVYTVHQNPGEFVITFPRAYHSGFNQGLNFAEAVNFAPIDWLSMGRDCMLSYGRVGRKCVFAHDELVMKITRSVEKLSQSMALAALEELRIIHYREHENREAVMRKGVTRRDRLIFEQIEDDDEKMCTYCNTTLFMSGLRCSHGKSVCLDHMDHLCRKCPLEETVLLFSYEVEELVPLMDQLKNRTTLHEEWEKRAIIVKRDMENGVKPEASSLENLLDEARTRHYPLTEVYHQLNDVMNECKKTLNRARSILSEGVRVRSTTRNQRADPRCGVEGVKDVEEKLKQLPIDANQLHMEIVTLLNRVIDWDDRVYRVMEGDVDENEVNKLIEEGEQLNNIRLDELGPLKERERRQKWLNGGMKEFVEWKVENCDEMSVEWRNRKRWTFNDVHVMIDEGRRVGMGKSNYMKEMEKKRNAAGIMDDMARRVMEKNKNRRGMIQVKNVEETWKKGREVDWLNAPGLNGLREEMYHILSIRSYEDAKQYSLFDYVQWIDHLECSKTMDTKEGLPMTQVKAMKEWTDGLRKMFELEHSYHSLYEMLISRENVMVLAGGQRPTLRRETKSIESIELWKPVHVYDSTEKMIECLEGVFDRFPVEIDQLRRTHEGQSPSNTCPCLNEMDKEPILECIVCKAKTHLSCGWWNEYFGRLPPGCYLCVRCMRSRRPLIGEVKTWMESARGEWMETHLVQLSIDRFDETSVQVRKCHALWKENRDDIERQNRLSTLIISLLSLEMTDSSLLAFLTEPISVIFRGLLESQRDAWDALRGRCPSSLRGATLFTNRQSFSPLRKRKRRDKGEEKEIPCAHLDCILPLPATHLDLVKCQVCKRWYHVICTGLIIDPDLSDFKCC